MKRFLILLVLFVFFTTQIKAAHAGSLSYPCSIVLEQVKEIPNSSGTALIAKVKKPYTDQPDSPVRERTAIGIYADWMPLPSTFGEYDQYEGFAQIPGVISWRFNMYPVKEDQPSLFGGFPLAGKFDEISAQLSADAIVQLRLSNSRSGNLGPAILQGRLKGCVK
ncbi:hypothetical protein [Cytobacillus firmus]|uniref:hypothetical protein n=1 Tax=Cytobacillus firmus TaxID=1399 RepID=UPI002163E246|nr:hypothetical protein [Cytobacillus firmus]MCS0653218.1 hypothetical protein [Cytobacillus firmus]